MQFNPKGIFKASGDPDCLQKLKKFKIDFLYLFEDLGQIETFTIYQEKWYNV